MENVDWNAGSIAGYVFNVGIAIDGVYPVVSYEFTLRVVYDTLVGVSIHPYPVLLYGVIHLFPYVILNAFSRDFGEVEGYGILKTLLNGVKHSFFTLDEPGLNDAVEHFFVGIIKENIHIRIRRVDGVGDVELGVRNVENVLL